MGLNSTPTIAHGVTSASDTTMYEIKFYNSKIPLKVSGDFNLAFMAQNPVTKFFRSENTNHRDRCVVEVMQGLRIKSSTFTVLRQNKKVNFRTFENAVKKLLIFWILKDLERWRKIQRNHRASVPNIERSRLQQCGWMRRTSYHVVLLDQ